MKRRNFLALAFAPVLSRIIPKMSRFAGCRNEIWLNGRDISPFFAGEGQDLGRRVLRTRIRLTEEAAEDWNRQQLMAHIVRQEERAFNRETFK